MKILRIVGFCLISLLVVSMLSFSSTAMAKEPTPIVAVASNMRFVIEEIRKSFYRETGLSIRFSFGSSGNLTRQLLQGAPFEMFMSADEEYVFRLADAGKSIDRGRIYAFGRIATFTPKNSPLRAASFPDDYPTVLAKDARSRFAIANPNLAPYGRAAKEALLHAGLWEQLQPRLIYGENISQTAQFTLSGSTMGGIIAYSQALTPKFRNGGDFKLVPSDFHNPLGQRMVLLKGASETAKRFFRYIEEKEAQEIFLRSGYTIQKAGE